MNRRDKSPAFLAADAGYDVWLGNIRGNKYSRQHISLDPNRSNGQFWDFSFEQNGKIDLHDMIKHVKEVTKVDKI